MKYRFLVFLFVLLIASQLGAGVRPTVVSDMAESAAALLDAMPGQQRKSATFGLQDEERFNWHFIPKNRKGVPLRDLSGAQRKLAHSFLATGLSSQGHMKAARIMFLEEVLYRNEENSLRRDPDGYYYSVFGEPSEQGAWGWRLEGHHLSLNFTIQDGKVVSSTPSFWGSNPAIVRENGPRGLEALAPEQALGRQLLHSFKGAARNKVVIDANAPEDIITKASRRAQMGAPVGVAMKDMTKEQAGMLMELLEVYAHRLRRELAEKEMETARRAGADKLYFAWAGGSEAGQPHYYRIQGPSFVVEYDNVQNNANHIHSVWRNFDNDFGLDLLSEHHKRSHQN